jgi:predicted peroxiredoxin
MNSSGEHMAKKYLMVITHSDDDQDRANGAVGMAASLLGEGVDLVLFFVFDGARMAHRGVAETIVGAHMTPVRELFPILLEAKLPMYVCGACVKKYDIPEDELVDGVRIATLPTIAAEMTDRETIMF